MNEYQEKILTMNKQGKQQNLFNPLLPNVPF